jgi:hypothetical protein
MAINRLAIKKSLALLCEDHHCWSPLGRGGHCA